MLRNTSLFFFFVIITTAACKNDSAPPAPQNNPAIAQTTPNTPPSGTITYTVTSGTVFWSGKKTIGDSHEGTITVSSGELVVTNGNLERGKIVLDMHSLAVTSIKDGGEKRDLESHLKDVDFFEVNKFPTAEFAFNEVLPSNTQDFSQVASGELTIKGKTNGLNIPVTMKVSGDELTVRSPSFSINRTKWGITFRSGMLGTVKDKLIEDTVLLTFKLTAKRS
ncbi:MAG: YceI family protein [Saprospiraceae bacterium]|nr:YceI family protein [Saprospiraceae bacterium]